jgi:hypothetical protein
VIDDLLTRGVLTSGESIAYAAGLTHGGYRGLRTVGHGGADAGYRSDFVRFPDEDTSIAVLCSFPNADPGGRARKVADVVLEGRFPPAPASDGDAGDAGITLTAEQMAQVAGLYAREGTDVLEEVRLREGGLVFGGGQGRRLLVLAPDRFRLGGAEVRYTVGADGRGELRGVIDGRERTLRKVVEAPADALSRAEYAGTYWSDDLGAEYRVELAGGQLRMWNRKRGEMRVTARALDRFAAGNMQVTFTRDEAGRIDGFTASTGRVRRVRFDRGEPRRGQGNGR